MSALSDTLDTLAGLAEFAGKLLGLASPVGIIVNAGAVALRGADGIVRNLETAELERLHQEFESQRAGNESAWRASHQDFHKVRHYPPGMGEESRRIHREYNALVAAQIAGARNGAAVRALTDEAAAKGIILVPGGEHL